MASATENKQQNEENNITELFSTLSYHQADIFQHQSIDDLCIKRAEKLKEVRDLVSKFWGTTLESLVMVDAFQRIGIDHYFKDEIESVLQKQCTEFSVDGERVHHLYEVALRFRLLRQHGYYVQPDVFNNFMDKEGKFKSETDEDIKGLTELYEASQLSMEGECILDEAGDMSRKNLKAWMNQLVHHQDKIILNALAHPYHKSLSRFMAKTFSKSFQGTNGWINVVRELATLEFNITQSIHQSEVIQVLKWWEELGLAKELKFARNQPLKWYMWAMAVITDSCFSEQRVDITKPISLVYIIDDIYDVYATLDELTLFTEAVHSWEFPAGEKLPYYMKICLKALYDTTDEISSKIFKEHGWNPMETLKRTWANLCNAFLVEAKWFASGNLPQAEQYLKNGIVSSGIHVVLVHIFFLLGHGINKELVNLLEDNPAIISSTATILRLWDDLGSAKDEKQDGKDGSYVECYINEHKDTSVEDARKHVMSMISDKWKSLNLECLYTNSFPASFRKACLNTARMVPLMYNYDDNHHLPSLQEHMFSMLYGTEPF